MSISMPNISALKEGRAKISVSFPEALLVDLRKYVPARKRSRVIVEATAKMVEILKQQKAVKLAAGVWKDNEHPELDDGVDTYVRRVRDSWHNREARLELEKR